MKNKLMLIMMLLLQFMEVSSSFGSVTYSQVATQNNPAGVVLKSNFDPDHTGFTIYLLDTAGSDASKRLYVLANPYNNLPGVYQVFDRVQPLAAAILKANFNNGIYFVPFFVSQSSQKIINSSAVSSSNPADVWVAMFDSNKNLIQSIQVSDDNSSSAAHSVNYPVTQIWLQSLTDSNWIANVMLDTSNDSFAVSNSQTITNGLMSSTVTPSIASTLTSSQKVVPYASFLGPNDDPTQSNLWLSVTVNGTRYMLANAQRSGFSETGTTVVSSVKSVLNGLSVAQWTDGIYLSLIQGNNQVAVYVQDQRGKVLVTDFLPNATSITGNVTWAGSYIQPPSLPSNQTFGVTMGAASNLLSSITVPGIDIVTILQKNLDFSQGILSTIGSMNIPSKVDSFTINAVWKGSENNMYRYTSVQITDTNFAKMMAVLKKSPIIFSVFSDLDTATVTVTAKQGNGTIVFEQIKTGVVDQYGNPIPSGAQWNGLGGVYRIPPYHRHTQVLTSGTEFVMAMGGDVASTVGGGLALASNETIVGLEVAFSFEVSGSEITSNPVALPATVVTKVNAALAAGKQVSIVGQAISAAGSYSPSITVSSNGKKLFTYPTPGTIAPSLQATIMGSTYPMAPQATFKHMNVGYQTSNMAQAKLEPTGANFVIKVDNDAALGALGQAITGGTVTTTTTTTIGQQPQQTVNRGGTVINTDNNANAGAATNISQYIVEGNPSATIAKLRGHVSGIKLSSFMDALQHAGFNEGQSKFIATRLEILS